MKPDHKCIHCAIFKSNNGICPIFQRDTSMERGCPMFAAELDPCAICKRHIMGTPIWYIDDQEAGNTQVHKICEQCNGAMKAQPCQVCVNVPYCAFEQDQSCQLPPYVVVQQRQGNAVVQMQQKNPERIAATCAKGCKCYHADTCMREYGDCPNQKIAWEQLTK